MKYEVRAWTEITFDFDIEAESDMNAESQVKKLLPYIEKGKLERQPLTVKCGKGQKLRSVFVMGCVVADVNEID